MDDDKQAIAIGLGAGLGGFAGLIIVGCICWNICCGTWCEKKPVKSNVLPRSQRSTITAAKMQTAPSLKAPIRHSNLCSDSTAGASKDLAAQVQSTRR